MKMKNRFVMPLKNLRLTAPKNRARVEPLPGRRFEVKNDAADPDTTELYLYDEIGWWGTTANDFAGALASIKTPNLRLRVNSPGGDIMDGVAIYNLLAQHPANVHVSIDSLAASIASVICMAGDDVSIAHNGMMMIHRASGLAQGDADDMQAMKDLLEMCENSMIVPAYAAKTGMDATDLVAMMKAETWMDSATAVEKGFADRVAGDSEAKALIRPGLFAHTPKQFLNADGEWTCAAKKDLPIDEKDSWDGGAAAERIFEHAGFNGSSPNSEMARGYFLAYDKAKPTEKGSYKLPFCDFVGGTVKAIEGGLRAAASRLPQTDIPDSVKTEARAVLDHYFKRRDEEKGNQAVARVKAMSDRLRLARVSV